MREGRRRLINPPIPDRWSFGRACRQTLDRRRRRFENLPHERHQGLDLKRFGEKWETSTAYAVLRQVLVDIAGHEDYSQVFPYAERAHGQFVAMYVGELIRA
jgi:hypothetical protein